MSDFNMLAFAQGKSRAESSVTLYFDEAAARRADDATAFTEPGPGERPERYVADPEAFAEARAAIKASAVTIHLKGLDEGRVDELREEHGVKAGAEGTSAFSLDEGRNEEYLIAVLAEAFEKSVNAEGAEDSSARISDTTTESLREARKYWTDFKRVTPSSQWPKLLGEVVNIIFVSYIIDEAVDANRKFDPATTDRTFRLCLTDIGELTFLPPIMARLAREAPQASVSSVPMDIAQVAHRLAHGEVDGAIASVPLDVSGQRRVVRREHYVCILPEDLARLCRHVARALDLVWAGIDLRRTAAGEYFFLEANPSPMFLGFEAATGLPLTEALTELLLKA